jgi:hypothetical protein
MRTKDNGGLVPPAAMALASLKVVPSDGKLVEHFTAARPSFADRMAASKALRTNVPPREISGIQTFTKT